jgi:hypothetical protein
MATEFVRQEGSYDHSVKVNTASQSKSKEASYSAKATPAKDLPSHTQSPKMSNKR